MNRLISLLSILCVYATAPTASAGTIINFDTDPFAGSTALTTPGRQVVGNELFLPSFAPDDVFLFDSGVYGVYGLTSPLRFSNTLAASIPSSGLNMIVLQNSDNDNNTATAFNAGTAANLIAAQIDTPTPGFFMYFNSGLGVNRLVFSTDLSDPTADLKILARITSPTGQAAIDALPSFTESNFQTSAVPTPASAVMLMIGAIFGIPISLRNRPRLKSPSNVTC